MQNLKIRVNNEAESKEAQELFFELGFSWNGNKIVQDLSFPVSGKYWLCAKNGTGLFNCIKWGTGHDSGKLITLPELRAMANPMKEYLMPSRNYEYILTDAREALEPHAEDWIEIPEGAEGAVFNGEKILFAKPINDGDDVLVFEVAHDLDWHTTKWESWNEFVSYGFDFIWQREQDEPFLTPECTLNDQYAEIEGVRQVEIHGTVKAEPDFNFGAAQASGGAKENVNHPSHYTSDPSGIECIEVTRHRNFNIGNAMKYLWRNGLKDSDAQIQDLKKAIWYIEDEIKRLEK